MDFPASSPYCLDCGGTQVQTSNGTINDESVWNDGARRSAPTTFATPVISSQGEFALAVRPKTWVTSRSAHMGDTHCFRVGGVDAVERVFGHGIAPSVRCPPDRGRGNECREFGISRKTGCKIFNRYQEEGVAALTDRSRRSVRCANQLPPQIGTLIVRSKKRQAALGCPQTAAIGTHSPLGAQSSA